MKKGKVKRLISEIGKTVQALELEDRVYAERHRRGVDLRACRADVCVIAADNQAPHLSEIYAGFANITRRAKLLASVPSSPSTRSTGTTSRRRRSWRTALPSTLPGSPW